MDHGWRVGFYFYNINQSGMFGICRNKMLRFMGTRIYLIIKIGHSKRTDSNLWRKDTFSRLSVSRRLYHFKILLALLLVAVVLRFRFFSFFIILSNQPQSQSVNVRFGVCFDVET